MKTKRRQRALRPLQDRFDEKYIEEPNSGCWLWVASLSTAGYGQIKLGARGTPVVRAHRVSFVLHRHAIPDGMDVLHKCDTRVCVNPDHLFLGTHADNMRDMVEKGRAHSQKHPELFFGERNPRAKLTIDQVRLVRNASGTMKQVAARFGISPAAVCLIQNRKTWAHVI